MNALEPGLYRATVRGVADVTVLVDSHGLGTTANKINDGNYHGEDQITDARPLIVLDSSWTPAECIAALQSVSSRWVPILDFNILHEIAQQIEVQTKLVRIEEPEHIGLRVIAVDDTSSGSGRVACPWTRFSTILTANWIDAGGRRRCWDDLINPTLISDGVMT